MAEALATCAFCGEPVDPYSTTTFRKVSGWDHPRKGGGTNALACCEKHDEWACYQCIQNRKRGINTEQASLL